MKSNLRMYRVSSSSAIYLNNQSLKYVNHPQIHPQANNCIFFVEGGCPRQQPTHHDHHHHHHLLDVESTVLGVHTPPRCLLHEKVCSTTYGCIPFRPSIRHDSKIGLLDYSWCLIQSQDFVQRILCILGQGIGY